MPGKYHDVHHLINDKTGQTWCNRAIKHLLTTKLEAKFNCKICRNMLTLHKARETVDEQSGVQHRNEEAA